MNDHRNRQALPVMGVFLQPDPLGFAGGDSNLYRYCGNNAVNRRDPTGLSSPEPPKFNIGWSSSVGYGPGFTTQGWWSSPSGIPTGVAGSGPPAGDRLGNGSQSVPFGYMAETDQVVVEADFVRFDSNPVGENFGFLLGDITTLLNPKIDWGRLEPFFTLGTLKIDADGALTTNYSHDPAFQSNTSALKDRNGNYVVPSQGTYGVDAYTDVYAVAPTFMFRIGDTVTIISSNGASITTQIGDYGSNSNWFGEVSIAGARDLGANIKFGPNGPVTLGPNTTVMIIVYPGTGR